MSETNNKIELAQDLVATNNYVSMDTKDVDLVKQKIKEVSGIGQAIVGALMQGINADYAPVKQGGKPSLLQPGARKICLMCGLTARFPKEYQTIDKDWMIVTLRCELYNLRNEKVSESDGSATIEQNPRGYGQKVDMGWELNRAIKMAQKRAMVGATLQLFDLSSVLTQDIEDIYENNECKTRYNEVMNYAMRCGHPVKDECARFVKQIVKDMGMTIEHFQKELSEAEKELLINAIQNKTKENGGIDSNPLLNSFKVKEIK